MHIPRPSRRPRRLLYLAGLAGLLVSLVAPSSALAAGINYYWSPLVNGTNGWYTYSSIEVQVRVTTFGLDSFPISGDFDERIASVDCSPNGGYDQPLYVDTIVSVVIAGDTDGQGVTASCTAKFERRTHSSCTVFGCVISDWRHTDTKTWFSDRIRIDSSPPVLLPPDVTVTPNAAGWYRTPGEVRFRGSDPHSSVASCTVGTISGPDSAFKSYRGTCTNAAGLQASGGFPYKYDATAPTLAPTVSPNQVVLGGSATAAPNANDATSGIESAGCDPVDTSAGGTHTVECRATDRAGNVRTATASYSVGYGFSGFEQPVDAAARNIARAGRTIPLKWQVTDGAGNPVTDLTGVAVSATSLTCSLGTTTDEIEEYAAGGSGLQNLGGGWYQFNWSSPKSYAGSCKTVSVNLGDGVPRTAAFEFTK